MQNSQKKIDLLFKEIINQNRVISITLKIKVQLLQIKSPKIVYVSCNPATQARDLQSLTTLYKIEKVQPVDMFPHTHHIENVVLLSLIA